MHFDMSVETFLTVLYCVVDELYQTHAPVLLAGKVGSKPEFSDSEVLTLMVAQHWCGFQKEATWLRFVKNNYLALFPRLLDQSQFNRRARNLCWLLNHLRQKILAQMGALQETLRLIDGTPVHVRHWRRYGPGHLALPEAALGHCAAKKESFYGYRLVVLTTPDGVITDWELISANADEREAAWDMLYEYKELLCLGDKGFLERLRQQVLAEDREVSVADTQAQEPERAKPCRLGCDHEPGASADRDDILAEQGRFWPGETVCPYAMGTDQSDYRQVDGHDHRRAVQQTARTLAVDIGGVQVLIHFTLTVIRYGAYQGVDSARIVHISQCQGCLLTHHPNIMRQHLNQAIYRLGIVNLSKRC